MTRDEVIKSLMIIQAAYPNYNPPDKTITVNLWYGMLNDYSYNQVEAAIKAFIRTDRKGFAPGIGEVIEKLQLLFGNEEDLNPLEAWGIVLKAIKNSTYHSEEEFERLPDLIKKSVGSAMQLKEWATAEVNDNTVSGWQSKFISTYKLECSKRTEKMKLSPDLLCMIEDKNRSKTAVKELEQKSKNVLTENTKDYVGVEMPEHAKNKLKDILGIH